ncbi:hypothetical protein AAG570_000578 [Ranatra chinensis]|uniref:Uncharacterized protein n=1 Tax=Ranatra chinensis TaxID=642074 RepID=A0ABD0ZIM4_9HEMI
MVAISRDRFNELRPRDGRLSPGSVNSMEQNFTVPETAPDVLSLPLSATKEHCSAGYVRLQDVGAQNKKEDADLIAASGYASGIINQSWLGASGNELRVNEGIKPKVPRVPRPRPLLAGKEICRMSLALSSTLRSSFLWNIRGGPPGVLKRGLNDPSPRGLGEESSSPVHLLLPPSSTPSPPPSSSVLLVSSDLRAVSLFLPPRESSPIELLPPLRPPGRPAGLFPQSTYWGGGWGIPERLRRDTCQSTSSLPELPPAGSHRSSPAPSLCPSLLPISLSFHLLLVPRVAQAEDKNKKQETTEIGTCNLSSISGRQMSTAEITVAECPLSWRVLFTEGSSGGHSLGANTRSLVSPTYHSGREFILSVIVESTSASSLISVGGEKRRRQELRELSPFRKVRRVNLKNFKFCAT